MATVTPNFNWPVPTSTDLVKDGATAMEALGDAIDTSMVDLKGGTTGQVLAKASNTDMDFSWVAQDDSNAIQNSIVNAKGDLIGASANDTPAILSVGAANTFLRPNSSAATGLEWVDGFTSYTPTLSAFGGTGPTLGNGTLEGRYLRVGRLCYYQISLTFGSTSTYGSTSAYAFGLPFSSSQFAILGQAIILDAGTNWYYNYQAESKTQGSGAFVGLVGVNGGATSSVRQNFPITFGTGDGIFISGVYEVA